MVPVVVAFMTFLSGAMLLAAFASFIKRKLALAVIMTAIDVASFFFLLWLTSGL